MLVWRQPLLWEVHKPRIAWSKEGTAGEGLILHCLHPLLAMLGDGIRGGGILGSGVLAHVAFCCDTGQVPALLSLLTLIKNKTKQNPNKNPKQQKHSLKEKRGKRQP